MGRGMACDSELATGTQDRIIAWGAGGGSAGEEIDRASDVGCSSELARAMVQERMSSQAQAPGAGGAGDGAGTGGVRKVGQTGIDFCWNGCSALPGSIPVRL